MFQMMQKDMNLLEFQRSFTIKDAMFMFRDSVTSTTISRAWHNFYPINEGENHDRFHKSNSTAAELEPNYDSLQPNINSLKL